MSGMTVDAVLAVVCIVLASAMLAVGLLLALDGPAPAPSVERGHAGGSVVLSAGGER